MSSMLSGGRSTQDDEVCALLYGEGHTIAEIAAAAGCGEDEVVASLARQGVDDFVGLDSESEGDLLFAPTADQGAAPGVEAASEPSWTRESIVECLGAYYREHGRFPNRNAHVLDATLPGTDDLFAAFGVSRFNDAMRLVRHELGLVGPETTFTTTADERRTVQVTDRKAASRHRKKSLAAENAQKERRWRNRKSVNGLLFALKHAGCRSDREYLADLAGVTLSTIRSGDVSEERLEALRVTIERIVAEHATVRPAPAADTESPTTGAMQGPPADEPKAGTPIERGFALIIGGLTDRRMAALPFVQPDYDAMIAHVRDFAAEKFGVNIAADVVRAVGSPAERIAEGFRLLVAELTATRDAALPFARPEHDTMLTHIRTFAETMFAVQIEAQA